MESEGRREHGAVALDRGNTEGFGKPQPAEEVGHLSKRWSRNRVTVSGTKSGTPAT